MNDAIRQHMVAELYPGSALSGRAARFRRPRLEDLTQLATIVTRPEFDGFCVAVVGSILDSKVEARDIDLVVSLASHRCHASGRAELGRIENALATLRAYGVQHLGVSVDPSFRYIDEATLVATFDAGLPFSTIKLDAPRWMRARRGGSSTVRAVGRIAVELIRRAPETSYLSKLPFCSRGRPRLRPAVDLHDFARGSGKKVTQRHADVQP